MAGQLELLVVVAWEEEVVVVAAAESVRSWVGLLKRLLLQHPLLVQ